MVARPTRCRRSRCLTSVQPMPSRWRAQRGMWTAAAVHPPLAVATTTVLPVVPRLGVVGSGADYGMQGQSGLWVNEPQTAIAALMLYFVLLGQTRLCNWDESWGRQTERQPRPSLDAGFDRHLIQSRMGRVEIARPRWPTALRSRQGRRRCAAWFYPGGRLHGNRSSKCRQRRQETGSLMVKLVA